MRKQSTIKVQKLSRQSKAVAKKVALVLALLVLAVIYILINKESHELEHHTFQNDVTKKQPIVDENSSNSSKNVSSSSSSSRDDELSKLLNAQQNRLKLIKAGIEPILPGPSSTIENENDNEKIIGTIQNYIKNKDETVFQDIYDDIGEWKYNLYSRLDYIRLKCGKLCQLNTPSEIEQHLSPKLPTEEGGVLPLATVPDVDCDSILSLEEIDAGDMTFPRTIPDELLKYYSLDGNAHIHLDKYIRQDAYLEGSAEKSLWPTGNVWEEKDINDAVAKVANKTLAGPYGLEETISLTENLAQLNLKDKSVLVIGSSHPWVEAICLHHGAAKVTTLEYGEIISKHPKIETETPRSIREKYVKGGLDMFDRVVTHSSVEHSGLGRYGDALNPWGDILAIARAWCITKPKALLWVAVPTGKDTVFYNWHRIYGRLRWPVLAMNWRQVGKDVQIKDEDELFSRGIWKSMVNIGFAFEKVDPNIIEKD